MSHYSQYIDYYHQYKHKVYSFFYYRLNNDQLAEDLTSETFLKAFEKFDSYNSNYAFSTWIYTIAKNNLTDFWRKNHEHDSIEDMADNDIEIKDKTSEDFTKELNDDLSVEQVKKVLDILPDLQKECIILKYLEDLDTKEIAKITGKTEDNIRQNLSRGIKAIKAKGLELLFLLFYYLEM